MADQSNVRDSDIADIHATLRALEPALTRTAELLPRLVSDVHELRRGVDLIPGIATVLAEMHTDLQEIKLLLRNGHG